MIASSSRNFFKQQNGNVLFLILIAVALFAALSYAVTNSNRTSSDSMSYERAKSCVAEIDSLFSSIQTGIARIKAKGYQDYEIDISTDVYKSKSGTILNTANATCTSNDCRLYADKGGTVPPMLLSADCLDLTDNYFAGSAAAGHVIFQALKIPDVGTPTENSLFARIIRINDAVCRAWNYREGLTSIASGPVPNPEWFGGTASSQSYNGTITSFPIENGTDHATLGTPVTATTSGKYTFCYTLDTALGTRGILSAVIVR